MRLNDITGLTFGRWTVVQRAPNQIIGKGRFSLSYWTCQCECGQTKDVRAASLTRGKSKSCGCYLAEYQASMVTHGMSKKAPEYKVWSNMLNRCRNPKMPGWHHYGGRGITVCDEWISFENFIADMGLRPSPKHSIDRIEVDLGYSKANCRWTTAKEQVANRRKIAPLASFTTDELLAELRRRGVAA